MSAPFVWENFFRKKESEDIFTLLKRVPIFESLSKHELKFIERILHRRTYDENEIIFREGEAGLGMYIIEEGEVTIHSGTRDNVLARLTDGEFFGEMALFSDQPRYASATATKPTKVFGFFQPDLFSLMETRPKLGVSVVMKLARIIAERLHRATTEYKSLSQRQAASGK